MSPDGDDIDVDTAADSVPESSTETVLVATGYSKTVFHTRDDCIKLPSSTRPWDRYLAVAWGLDHCKYCSRKQTKSNPHIDGEIDTNTDTDSDTNTDTDQ